MLTLQQKSQTSNHRANGFDYLRIILAVLIVAWHSVGICYGEGIYSGLTLLSPFVLFLVPSFFALSGFLVSGSLFRTNHLPTFLTLRVIRIFPALICEVVISALIIGATLSTLPLSDYISDPIFHKYFLNIIGKIQYTLPGVFENNPSHSVNAQLWTIPYELECYIAISLLYLVTLHRRPWAFLTLMVVGTLAITWYTLGNTPAATAFRPSGRFAVAAFLWGITVYQFRERLPHNIYLFLGTIFIAWLALSTRYMEYLAAPAVAYITIYIGLCNFRKTFVLIAGDISYGIYLYGFAIQQAVYQVLPSFRTWHENFLISLAIACIFGTLSWTLIESKILKKKDFCVRFVRSFTDRFSRTQPVRV